MSVRSPAGLPQHIGRHSGARSVVWFALAAVICISPFAVYRALTGQYLVALLDALLVLAIGAAGLYAWRFNRYLAASRIVGGCVVLGCIAVTWVAGRAGLVWSYPILLVVFFVIERREAALAAAVLLLGLLAVDAAFDGPLERFSFFASGLLTTGLAFIFAQRTDRQHAQLAALASYDPLTQAGNRRLMEHELETVLQGRQPGQPLPGLAVIDLDHFKRVNDQFGHDAGDRVLVDFAGLLRDGIRKSDRLFRFGGEEFVLLLPATDREGLQCALQKLLGQVRSRLQGPGGPVTASFGAAIWKPQERWTDWLARADAALYVAKRQGRDRVVIDSVDGDIERMERRGRDG